MRIALIHTRRPEALARLSQADAPYSTSFDEAGELSRGKHTPCSSWPDKKEVLAMLRSDEYTVIQADYDNTSREHLLEAIFVPTSELRKKRRAVSTG